MVVANAVAALSEINEASQSGQPLVGELVIFSLNLVILIISTKSNSELCIFVRSGYFGQ